MTQVEMTGKKMTDEIWILGATGRIGRPAASALVARGAKVVLVGRNRERLDELSRNLGAPVGSVIADGPDRIVEEITTRRPAVVVNTVGPFSETGVAVVAKLCEGLPTPRSVHVDAIPSVQTEGGPLGEALAATIVEAIPQGSSRYENSRLTKARLGAGVKQIALPDGETVTAGSAPLGDLHAAWLISGAPTVVASSTAEVATRLAAGQAPAGAFTPTRALGPDIAASAGAEFVLD